MQEEPEYSSTVTSGLPEIIIISKSFFLVFVLFVGYNINKLFPLVIRTPW